QVRNFFDHGKPFPDLILIGAARVPKSWPNTHRKHTAKPLFAHEAVVDQRRDPPFQLRRIRTKAATPVAEPGSDAALRAEVGNLLKGGPTHGPMIWLLLDPAQDFHQRDPGGVHARRGRLGLA